MSYLVVPSFYRERYIPQNWRSWLETGNKVSLTLVCDVLQNDRQDCAMAQEVDINYSSWLLQPKISDLCVSQFSSFTTADIEKKNASQWLLSCLNVQKPNKTS